jgi:hypothetical protein
VTVLFLDVDGVLVPLRARSSSAGAAAWGSGNPLLERLDPADGPRLLALGADLVWATSWLGEANEVVGPRLGLPPLPCVDWASALRGLGLRPAWIEPPPCGDWASALRGLSLRGR